MLCYSRAVESVVYGARKWMGLSYTVLGACLILYLSCCQGSSVTRVQLWLSG